MPCFYTSTLPAKIKNKKLEFVPPQFFVCVGRNEQVQTLDYVCLRVWKLLLIASGVKKKKKMLVFILQREKKSLLKLLSSNKKKSRPSPPSSPTLEAEQAAAAGELLHGAVGLDTSPPSGPASCLDSEPAAASASSSSSSSVPESSHRKSSPLDGCVPIAPPPRQPCSSLLSQQHDARPIICER